MSIVASGSGIRGTVCVCHCHFFRQMKSGSHYSFTQGWKQRKMMFMSVLVGNQMTQKEVFEIQQYAFKSTSIKPHNLFQYHHSSCSYYKEFKDSTGKVPTTACQWIYQQQISLNPEQLRLDNGFPTLAIDIWTLSLNIVVSLSILETILCWRFY